MNLRNLFNECNKLLEDTLNTFLKDYWRDIFNECMPSLSGLFNGMLKNIMNDVFTKIPFNELFME